MEGPHARERKSELVPLFIDTFGSLSECLIDASRHESARGSRSGS
jgi:hypothetical protein